MQGPNNRQADLEAMAARARSTVWRLDMGPRLEAEYQADHRERAVAFFRHSSIFIFLIYLLLSSGIWQFMPKDELTRWLSLYGWVGVIILAASVLSRISLLDDWFELYTGFGSFGAVALSVAVTGVVINPVAGQLTQVAIMYAIVIIYSMVGLRLKHAFYAGWMGGLAGTVLAWLMGGCAACATTRRNWAGRFWVSTSRVPFSPPSRATAARMTRAR